MMNMSMGEAVAWLAGQAPDRPMITCGQNSISRVEFERSTNRLARMYAGLGVDAGAMVTIALPNSIEFFEATVAALKLGATPQPLSASLPRPELEAVIALADPAIIVGDHFEWVRDRPVVGRSDRSAIGVDGSPLPVRVAERWKAPTSGGSTGTPKLIVSCDPGTIDPATSVGYGMRVDATQLIAGPLYHNGPFLYAMRGLLTGGHVVVMERFEARRWLELVAQFSVQFALLVPTHMHRISRLGEVALETDVSSLEMVLHLGAPCPEWLKRWWVDWIGPDRVAEIYAGTEGVAATWITGAEWLHRPGSVGRALYGEFVVLDRDRAIVPTNSVGEIWMRRPERRDPVFRYLGAQPEVIDGGWYSLGDMGWMDDDGYLYVADRRTDLIIRGGANIYPAEVEAALSKHPAVITCAVIGLDDEDLGQRVHAIVQATRPVPEGEFRAYLRGQLASYKVPETFELVDEPLRDAAGKVRRAQLRDARRPGEKHTPRGGRSSGRCRPAATSRPRPPC